MNGNILQYTELKDASSVVNGFDCLNITVMQLKKYLH